MIFFCVLVCVKCGGSGRGITQKDLKGDMFTDSELLSLGGGQSIAFDPSLRFNTHHERIVFVFSVLKLHFQPTGKEKRNAALGRRDPSILGHPRFPSRLYWKNANRERALLFSSFWAHQTVVDQLSPRVLLQTT